MPLLRVGYFENFKGDDTLLLESDSEGIARLADLLRSLATGERNRLALHDLPLFEMHHGIEVTATISARDRGLQRHGVENVFLWERTQEGWETAIELLEAFRDGESPCHQYLDAEGIYTEEIVVQVSRNEYGDAWWSKHGE